MVECVAVPHLLEQASQRIGDLRDSRGLFKEKDQQQPDLLLPLAVGEVAELQEALDQNEHVAALDELMDVLNYYFAYLMTTHQQPESVGQLMHGVNGYGKNSAAIDQLSEVILDSQDDPKAITETLRRLYSLGQYLPIPFVSITQLDRTIAKVAANRPAQFYSGLDPLTGRALTGEDASWAFCHFEKCLRAIRDRKLRTLQPQDWQPHQNEIADWHHSAENLAKLRQRLKVEPA